MGLFLPTWAIFTCHKTHYPITNRNLQFNPIFPQEAELSSRSYHCRKSRRPVVDSGSLSSDRTVVVGEAMSGSRSATVAPAVEILQVVELSGLVLNSLVYSEYHTPNSSMRRVKLYYDSGLFSRKRK